MLRRGLFFSTGQTPCAISPPMPARRSPSTSHSAWLLTRPRSKESLNCCAMPRATAPSTRRWRKSARKSCARQSRRAPGAERQQCEASRLFGARPRSPSRSRAPKQERGAGRAAPGALSKSYSRGRRVVSRSHPPYT